MSKSLPNQRTGLERRITSFSTAAVWVIFLACSNSTTSTDPKSDPRFTPVATATSTQKTRIIKKRKVGAREARLEVAADRILGVHIPMRFKLKKRGPGEAFGQLIAKTRHIKAFYTSLGYQIVEQRVGLRIYPGEPALRGLDPASKQLAKKTYLNLVRGKNLIWTLQIHAPPPSEALVEKPDPMAFILRKLNEAQKKPDPVNSDAEENATKSGNQGRASSKTASKPKPKSKVTVPRQINYIRPKGSVNFRPGLRKWNKKHPERPFLD